MAVLKRFRLFALSTLTTLALASLSFPAALAQDSTAEDSTVIYPADYFAEYAPITAQDMLIRIPGQGQNTGGGGGSGGSSSGLSSSSGGSASSGGRGLGAGSGGNEVLVNGKRTAGKNNRTSDLLRRISASQVREIQIIRGTSGELDVRGSGQVVNIVLYEELASSSIAYELSAELFKDDTVEPGGSMALSGQSGDITYQISATSRRQQ
jgi:outer membrane receptor for ferrienterochelin and colicins